MKTTTLLGVLALPSLLLNVTYASPVGTAFTYQSKLTSGTNAANGLYDFSFAVFDDPVGGTQKGPTLNTNAVPVNTGLFTVTLDFGNVFSGEGRWLAVSVKTNLAGAYTVLLPRQPLTPAPYAIYASQAQSAVTAGLATNVGSSAVGSGQLNTPAPPLNGQVLSYSGGALVWSSPPGALLGYKENGTFAVGPLASGANAIAQGEHAQALGNDSVVGGGLDNVAGHWFTTVGGGWSNSAGGFLFGRTTIGGGEMNIASGDWATVGGGHLNTAGGPLWGRATVAGGWQNLASGDMSTIAGGSQNSAVIGHAAIGGGQANVISNGAWSTISGGYSNLVVGLWATVGGGSENLVTNTHGTVAGGGQNRSLGVSATVAGGFYNLAGAQDSTVGGGYQNQANGQASTVGGGTGNTSSGPSSTASGGWVNLASANASTVGGGANNSAVGTYSAVAGGGANTASGGNAFVGGGDHNTAGGYAATVPGGANNRANADYSFAAGQSAVASAQGSIVFADASGGDFVSSLANEFAIRAYNGVRVQSDVGLHLNAVNRPLIVRDWDPFSSGAANGKANIGRWGLFMEPYALVIGIPNTDVGARYMEVARYNTDGTRDKIFGVGNNGVTTVKVLTITGGSDLAEPFAISDPDHAPKGTVMVIDDQQPGQLRVSSQPYDKRVAGVISGAGGLNPGVTIAQAGLTDQGAPVALSGRVYALADTSNGPIQPGDLLTTSSTPGHAMKVTDHARGQGAVIGKAMSHLREGRGLVLVLVSLQ